MRFKTTYLPLGCSDDWTFRFAPEDVVRDSFVVPYDAAEPHAWCTEQFGPDGPQWRIAYGCFMFTRQIDATAFRIRWG